MIMNPDSKIYVAGHRGLVGSAIWKQLESKGYKNLIGRSSSELDLTDAVATEQQLHRRRAGQGAHHAPARSAVG